MMSSRYVMSAAHPEEIPPQHKPQVAMVGRSNAGKSSFINYLTNRKDLAHVSSAPGRTQTINLYEIDERFLLVDLPGYGYAKMPAQKHADLDEMIQRYLVDTTDIKLIFLIISATPGMTDLDEGMLNFLQSMQLPVILIVNKMDKLNQAESSALLRSLAAEYPDLLIIPHSNIAGKTRSQLLGLISEHIQA
jgi:GTP-binding protein